MSGSTLLKLGSLRLGGLLPRLISVAAIAWTAHVQATLYISTELTLDQGIGIANFVGDPRGVAFDAAGNLYISDRANHRVFKRDVFGQVSTVGGTGVGGFSGDGGSATAAGLRAPTSVVADASGNLYVADTGNHRIRKISTNGTITTVAGTGTAGFSGDGGAATSATLSSPGAVVVDAAGNLFISDNGNHRIRKVTPVGTIETVAGSGSQSFGGDGGLATLASLNAPSDIAVSSAGTLYIADFNNHRVRKVVAGTITTVAGSGTAGFAGDGAAAIEALLNGPRAVALDASGNLYVSDLNNDRIRRVDVGGVINTVAGNGRAGVVGDAGDAAASVLSGPRGLAFDILGRLYVADTGNKAVRKISTGGIGTVVGNGSTGLSADGVSSIAATLNQPRSVAYEGYSSNVYIADSGNNRILKVDGATGIVSTALGGGSVTDPGSGITSQAKLSFPRAVAFDRVTGYLYVADTGNHRILQVAGGTFLKVAGTGSPGFSGDGVFATDAALNLPIGIAVDPSVGFPRNLYIADSGNHRVRMVNIDSRVISTVAGTGVAGYSGDNVPALSSRLNAPSQVIVDERGYLYVSDSGNNRIRRVDPTGNRMITTVAGNGTAGFSGDGGSAAAAMISSPSGLVHGGSTGPAAGSLYFSDRLNNRIRVVDANGVISTVVGNGTAGFSGDGADPILAKLNAPYGVALRIDVLDSYPHLLVADSGNNRIREAAAIRTQTINFAPLSDRVFGGARVAISAYASSGLSVTFSTLTPLTCSIVADTVLLLAPGTCSIAGDQSGGGEWAPAAQVVRSFVIAAPAAQTITFATPADRALNSGSFNAMASASSGLASVFSSTTAPVCTVSSGGTVSLVSAGKCTIAANQAGNASYAAAPTVTQSFTVLQTQTISFSAPATQVVGTSLSLASAASSSGLALSYSSLTPSVCSVSGSTATLLSVGVCTVAVSQPGDATYAAAATVTQPFAVTGVLPGFSAAKMLPSARSIHTSTLLMDGRVLLAGGYAGTLLGTATVFDPARNEWAAVGPLTNARDFHTATMLLNGKVLVAGGSGAAGTLNSAELFDPAMGTWSTTGDLGTARLGHTATLLADGRVLVTGGCDNVGGAVFASSEIYDPATGLWSAATSPMTTARYDHSAVRLANGYVLAMGGSAGLGGPSLASVELFNPGSNTWAVVTPMSQPRRLHTALRLGSGKVLVAGGLNGATVMGTAELFDPTTNSWSAATPLAAARYLATANLLPEGRALVAGGLPDCCSPALSLVETYDESTNLWSLANPLAQGRGYHTATMLASGKVLFAGGNANPGDLASVERYDPGLDLVQPLPSLGTARANHQNVVVASDGTVLAIGGRSDASTVLATTELRDPATGLWSPDLPMSTPRQNMRATLLPSGAVFVTGGSSSNLVGSVALASTESFQRGAGWTSKSPMSTARTNHRQTLLNDGSVLVTGGQATVGGASIAVVERFNATTNTWTSAGTMLEARVGHRATLLRDGRVLVTGGQSGATFSSTAELYDPVANSWLVATPMSVARAGHRAVLMPDGRVMVIGGQTSGGSYLGGVEIYDPTTNSWAPTGSLATARIQGAADVLPNGEVTLAGGTDASGVLGSIERYDPVTGLWQPSGALSTPRSGQSSVLLPSGSLLFAGGSLGSTSSTAVDSFQRSLGYPGSAQPIVTSVADASGGTSVGLGSRLIVTGSEFVSSGGGSGGNGTQNSSTNYPVALLQRVDDGQQAWLGVDASTSFSGTSLTTGPISGIGPGLAWLTLFKNGVPSAPVAVTLTALPVTTTTTLSISTASSFLALQPITLTASVTGGAPTGTVQFTRNGVALGLPVTLNGDGVASYEQTLPPAGSATYGANYLGDGNNASSSAASVVQAVRAIATTTSVSTSGPVVNLGSPVILTATLGYTGSVSPAGTLQFQDGGVILGSPVLVANGVAQYSTNQLTGGAHSITAVYSGDLNYSTSSGFVGQSVNKGSTTTTVTANPSSPTPGQSTTLTANVVFLPPAGGFQPSGTVQFYDGINALGSPVALSGGQAVLVTTALVAGAHSITSVYGGDANGNPSTSQPLSVIVQAASGGGDIPTLPGWGLILLGMTLLAQGWRRKVR